MKKLLIVTLQYPFGNKEQFLHNEISLLKDKYDITVFPTEINEKNPIRTDFKDCNLICVNKMGFKTKIIAMICTFKFFITKRFFKEFIFVIKNHNKLTNLLHLCKFVIKGEYRFHLIKKKINELNNSEIVLYSYWLYYQAFIISRLNEVYNVPIISRAHGFDLYEYRNKGKYIPFRNYILSSMKKIFLISNDGKEYLKAKYANFTEKYIVNRLGTKDFGFKLYDSIDVINIVSCSWLVPVKRVNLIVDALFLIKDININWIHFGDGPMMSEILKRCMYLPKNIEYNIYGNTSNEIILSYYKNNYVDWFINVSESEGIPVSIIEAISFGIPIIATNVGGISEIVINEKNGFLLDKDFKPENLAQLILKSKEMKIKEKTMLRENSREIWVKDYNIFKNIQDLDNEIKKLY